MCGRYVVTQSTDDLADFFEAEVTTDRPAEPSWNVAPTDPVSVVVETLPKGDGEETPPLRRLETARWGLVPPWAKSLADGARMFNARIEEAAEKPAFRNAVKKRRAAIPASGYYEWKTAADGTKTPYFIHPAEGELMAFAGLYEWWKNPAAAEDDPARWVLSATILTQDSVGALAEIHNRMPVILDSAMLDEWIDPTTPGDQEILDAIAEAGIEASQYLDLREVGKAVGSVKNNHAGLIDEVTPINPL